MKECTCDQWKAHHHIPDDVGSSRRWPLLLCSWHMQCPPPAHISTKFMLALPLPSGLPSLGSKTSATVSVVESSKGCASGHGFILPLCLKDPCGEPRPLADKYFALPHQVWHHPVLWVLWSLWWPSYWWISCALPLAAFQISLPLWFC